MRIDTTTLPATAPTGLPRDDREAANQQLQSLFSEILTQSGHEGYASAPAYVPQQGIEHDIQQRWTDWFSEAVSGGGHASEEIDRAQLEQTYGEILLRSWNEGGYHDPSGFLSQLTEDEMTVVQHVHRLARPIDVTSLDQEGALNLLIPPPAQVDLNHDGLTQIGKGRMMRFPDSRTPPEVVQAWNETTADMDFREKSIYQFRMMAPTLLANMQVDENGQYLGRREPGDPEYVNPMASAHFSYIDLTQQYLDSLEHFQHQMPREQFVEQTAFWTQFQQNLQKHGAR